MSHKNRVYDSILGLLSNVDNPTPIVRLRRVPGFRHATVYAKLEWYNPFGAVKDRVAANLVRDAEEHHRLPEHVRLVEPTSGNTGIALAMLANAKGYDFTATVSNKVPAEKRASLRLFGTDLVELDDDLCPAPGAPEGAIARAADLGNQPGHYHLNQYKNPANPDAHYRTTGPEIRRQTEGTVTHFVAGLGTCGTITGTGRFLKEQRKEVRVLGVHPAPGHDIPGVRSLRQLEQTALFFPKEYDGLIEISTRKPSRLPADQPGGEHHRRAQLGDGARRRAQASFPTSRASSCVAMFPDNVFKYASSIRKHLPELFPSQPAATPRARLAGIVDSRGAPDVIDAAEAKALPRRDTLRDPRRRSRSPRNTSTRTPRRAERSAAGIARGGAHGPPRGSHAPILTVCKVGERSLSGMLLLKAWAINT